MLNTQFVECAEYICNELKTLYVKGGFGIVLTDKGKKRVIDAYDYNKKKEKIILAADNDTFAFDCCGLVKGIIWGFNGDKTKVYGGAKYETNGLDDLNEKGLLNICNDLSDDFTKLCPGELLYMPGHCGIFIGDERVIESSPSGSNGVQCNNISDKKWRVHAKLPMIEYPGESQKVNLQVPKYYLKIGNMGNEINKLQRALNKVINADLVVDGKFGPLTKKALIDFQYKYGLIKDGIYGPQCYNKMREVLNK